jgi:hypothetical protein
LYQTLNTAAFGPWNKVFEEQYQNSIRELQAFDRTANNPAARAQLVSRYPPGYWENLYSTFEQLRFARLCSWLRHHEAPQAYAGYSILIWRLNDIQLRAALISPPSELNEAPL